MAAAGVREGAPQQTCAGVEVGQREGHARRVEGRRGGLGAFAGLLPIAGDAARQADPAAALQEALDGRNRALEALFGYLPSLPGTSRNASASLLSGLAAYDQVLAAGLAGLVDSQRIPTEVKNTLIADITSLATLANELLLDVDGLADGLPGPVQAPLRVMIDAARARIDELARNLRTIVEGLP